MDTTPESKHSGEEFGTLILSKEISRSRLHASTIVFFIVGKSAPSITLSQMEVMVSQLVYNELEHPDTGYYSE